MGIITEALRKFAESLQITSASPGHINEVLQFDPNIDIDDDIKDLIKTEAGGTKKDIDNFKKGNVGKLQNLTEEQMGNVRQMAVDPAGFVITGVLRKFAKGAGIATLVIIFFETVKTIVDQLFQPGRVLDVRFREQIENQVIKFLERREQQELRQGFKQLITTTIGGLRGSRLTGQIGGNFYNPERIPIDYLDLRRLTDVNESAINPINRSTQIFTLSNRRIR